MYLPPGTTISIGEWKTAPLSETADYPCGLAWTTIGEVAEATGVDEVMAIKATPLDVEPKGVMLGKVYAVDPPVQYEGDDGAELTSAFVTASIGSSVILGEGNEFAVFASDAEGNILSWSAIYSDGDGPDWCAELAV